jgi:hypothetical protein
MVNELDKEMDVDKIRNWAKEDVPTLAKYLNNANQYLIP